MTKLAAAPAPASSAAAAIRALMAELNDALPERREVIAGCVAAILSRQHVLLLGAPGTAKSLTVRLLASALGGTYFERLLTKFSTPEELFGPVSLKALEQDSFRRVTAGKLPEADFAFVDEIFKANSAILNSLLSVINERIFHNDGAPVRCPLVSCFGASNELPDGKELEALFDRFLLRFDVGYLLRGASMRAMLADDAPESRVTVHLSMDDLRAAQAEVAAVKVTDATVDALLAVREACKAEGVVASDRRWKQALLVARAFAWLSGQHETSPEDLAFLSDSLWREPKERAKVAAIVGRLTDPVGSKAIEILDSARELSARVTALQGQEDRRAYVSACASALDGFRGQAKKLAELEKGSGRRAGQLIADAKAEIQALHSETARAVSAGLGLR